MKRIAILASGAGTNAENISRHFMNHAIGFVSLMLTNNPHAGIIERAEKLNIPCQVFSKKQFEDGSAILQKLNAEKIDFIVLAGFLLLVSDKLTDVYKGKIINIHPALLPLHGGKGMYGNRVHEAVIASGEIISGITIHHVNGKYDEGAIIFQAACHVAKNETAASLAEKIHRLEYRWFPVVVEKLIRQ